MYEHHLTRIALGGAVWLDGTASDVAWNNVKFMHNRAEGRLGSRGGALVATSSAQVSLKQCDFIGNRAFEGGAIALQGIHTSAMLNHNILQLNYATDLKVLGTTRSTGGAVFATTGSQVMLIVFLCRSHISLFAR